MFGPVEGEGVSVKLGVVVMVEGGADRETVLDGEDGLIRGNISIMSL
jgi:hypothetical protein